MGSFCRSPTPPPAPDPVAIANAQSASNIETAQAQQKLNMVNTAGPQGTVNYQADPTAPGGYRQVTTLSPAEQANYDLQHQAETGALNTANTQLGRVNDALATPLTMDGLPALSTGANGGPIQNTLGGYGNVQTGLGPQGQVQTGFDPGRQMQFGILGGGHIQNQIAGAGNVQTGFNGGPNLQYGYNSGQQVQGQVGPQNLAGAYQAAANASYGQAQSRLDPQFAQSENALRTRLANQGLSQNDTAYQTALQNFQQGKNDAYNQANFSAQGQGLNAENTLFGQSVQQGQFANQAAGQEYAQNQGQAQFYNSTAGQQYGQNLGAAQFANTAQQQQFGQNQAQLAAYNAAQAQGFGQNQAQEQAYNAAQQQQFGQNQSLFEAGNAAQQQQYTQALAAMQAGNAAQQQQFGQASTAGEFANSAQNQAYNQQLQNAGLSNAARQQGLQERAYIQNTPINQFTGLLGLGQVGMPQGINYTPTQVGQTDVIGANALSTQAQQAAYNAQVQQQSGLMNGLFSLGGAAIMHSDSRLKADAALIRRRKDGVGVWRFRYLTDAPNVVRVGVMAQELRKVRPDLVVRRPDGFLAVDYSGLDLEAA